MADDITFDVAFRGYNTTQVNELVALLDRASSSDDQLLRESALETLQEIAFDLAMRGYNRRQVETYLKRMRSQLNSEQP